MKPRILSDKKTPIELAIQSRGGFMLMKVLFFSGVLVFTNLANAVEEPLATIDVTENLATLNCVVKGSRMGAKNSLQMTVNSFVDPLGVSRRQLLVNYVVPGIYISDYYVYAMNRVTYEPTTKTYVITLRNVKEGSDRFVTARVVEENNPNLKIVETDLPSSDHNGYCVLTGLAPNS